MKRLLMILMLIAPAAWSDETEGIDLIDLVDYNHEAWSTDYSYRSDAGSFKIDLCLAYADCDQDYASGQSGVFEYTWTSLGHYIYANHERRCQWWGSEPDCDEYYGFIDARAVLDAELAEQAAIERAERAREAYENHPTIKCIREHASSGSTYQRDHKKALCIDEYGPEPEAP